MCAGAPTRIWFDDAWYDDGGGQRGHAKPGLERAQLLCLSCPAIQACRAAHTSEMYGVWFGTTPPERVALRRQQREERA